jgi:hypothetical protein
MRADVFFVQLKMHGYPAAGMADNKCQSKKEVKQNANI